MELGVNRHVETLFLKWSYPLLKVVISVLNAAVILYTYTYESTRCGRTGFAGPSSPPCGESFYLYRYLKMKVSLLNSIANPSRLQQSLFTGGSSITLSFSHFFKMTLTFSSVHGNLGGGVRSFLAYPSSFLEVSSSLLPGQDDRRKERKSWHPYARFLPYGLVWAASQT